MKAIVLLVVALSLLCIMPILSALFGGIGGFIVGIFFGDSILGILEQIGITGVSMFEVGAFLGFVAGFFRNSSKSD